MMISIKRPVSEPVIRIGERAVSDSAEEWTDRFR